MESPAQGLGGQAWLDRYLADQGQIRPDGGPQFAYKTSSTEYQQLADGLNGSGRMPTATPARAKGWLLYAAAWTEHGYVGEICACSPALQEIAAPAPEYSQDQDIFVTAPKHCGITGLEKRGSALPAVLSHCGLNATVKNHDK